MPYSFPITVDINNLDYREPDRWDNIDDNSETVTFDISLSQINSEIQLTHLKEQIEDILSEYKLPDQGDTLFYFAYIFYEFEGGEHINSEDTLKHASDTIKKLIALLKLKEQSESKDIALKISNKHLKGLEVIFDKPVIINGIWESLYSALIKSTTGSNNHILHKYLHGKELTLALLNEVQGKVRIRKGAFWNKALARFSSIVLHYLNEHSLLKGETKLSSTQARFIFDLLEAFKFIDRDEIESEPDDYIRTLLKNNIFS